MDLLENAGAVCECQSRPNIIFWWILGGIFGWPNFRGIKIKKLDFRVNCPSDFLVLMVLAYSNYKLSIPCISEVEIIHAQNLLWFAVPNCRIHSTTYYFANSLMQLWISFRILKMVVISADLDRLPDPEPPDPDTTGATLPDPDAVGAAPLSWEPVSWKE